MDKETLSNYGWIVICVLVLAVMIALATPFGDFVASAVKSTAQGLFDVNQGALDAAGIVIDDNSFGNGGGYDHNAPELHPNGTIPTGATYTKVDGTVLNAGDAFPETVNTGDVYVYGNYEYQYNRTYEAGMGFWFPDENFNGWGVLCTNNVATPGAILESINGKPIVGMRNTFNNHTALVDVPAIPTSVTILFDTFYNCTSIIKVPEIPNGVTDITGAFSQCTSLQVAPTIPSSVTKINSAFSGCTSLTGTITINTNPTTYNGCFQNVDMSKITLAGSCDSALKQTLANIGKNGSQVTIID